MRLWKNKKNIRKYYREVVKPRRKEAKQKDFRLVISDTVEDICMNFCKFGGSGSTCIWCQMHEGQCPFDELMKEVENDFN
jgi:formate hydrogenlyase subunit 6/NADH:ubiquinone oxidoreductase subunit I